MLIYFRCSAFVLPMVNKPEVLQLVARKAGAILGRNVSVKAVDREAVPVKNEKMDRLLDFGRSHADVIHIKE